MTKLQKRLAYLMLVMPYLAYPIGCSGQGNIILHGMVKDDSCMMSAHLFNSLMSVFDAISPKHFDVSVIGRSQTKHFLIKNMVIIDKIMQCIVKLKCSYQRKTIHEKNPY